MDFVRLGPRYSSTYKPDALIEGYNSLIWTERYLAPGEFELKSFDVERLSALLPEDTLVSHLETQEVMIVETHDIAMVGEEGQQQAEITIKGRSLDSFLEHRWVESNYQKKRFMRKRYTATGAACVLVWNAVDNASGKDVTRGDTDPDTEAMQNDYSWTTLDVIPNVCVSESASEEGASRKWLLEEGMLYPQLMKILDAGDLGLRVLRPVDQNRTATVVTIKTALADRGDIVRTPKVDVDAMQFNIYRGVDRRGSVKLSLMQGHVDAPTYLRSIMNFKTIVEVKSSHTVSDVARNGTEAAYTGLRRRVMDFEGGSPELPPEPEKPPELRKNATKAEREAREKAMDKWREKHGKWKNKCDRIIADFKEEATEAARDALKPRRRVSLFTGDMSISSPYEYRVHYNLGDRIMLYGDYGYTSEMVVYEYVRTEDADGDRGFPGLVTP